MSTFTTIRLRRWVPILVFGAFSLLMLFFTIQQYQRFERDLEEKTLLSLKERLARISSRAEDLMKHDLDSMVVNDIAEFAISSEIRSIVLIDDKGIVLHGSPMGWKERPASEVLPAFDRARFLAAQEDRRPDIRLSVDKTGISAYQPVAFPADSGQIASTHVGMIVVDYNLSQFKTEQRRTLLVQGSTIWAVGLALMLLLWFMLNRWLTRPLLHLKDIVHRYRLGDYAARTDISGAGELAELSASMNSMADEVLRKSAQLQAVLNAATEYAIIATDLNGVITVFNPGAERMTGHSAREVIGKQTPLLWHLDSEISAKSAEFSRILGRPVRDFAVFSEFARQGKVLADEWTMVRKNGELLTTRIVMTAILDEKERITGYLAVAEDITGRKLTEDMMRKSQARLESLFKISQYKAKTIQDLLDFALEEAIVLTESGIGYLYHYSEEKKEFTLNSWSKLVMNECAIAMPQTLYHLDKTGLWGEAVRQRKPIMENDYRAENPLKKGCPAGHARLQKFLTIPVFSGDRIVAVSGVANKQADYDDEDVRQLSLLMTSVWQIVERMRMEEVSRQQAHLLLEAQKVSKFGVYELDIAKGLWTSTDLLDEIFGIDNNFVRDVNGWTALIHPEDRPAMVEHFTNQVLKEKQMFDREYRIVRPVDRQERWVHGRGILRLNDDGAPLAMLGTIQDITDHRKSEELIANILESVDEGFIIVDRNFQVLSANRAYAKMNGLPLEKVIGGHCYAVSHHVSSPCFTSGQVCAVNTVFETGNPGSCVHVHQDAKGGSVHIETKAYPLAKDSSGKVVTVIETLVDITERKKLEDQLHHAQKMESIGTLAGGIAHDFNNILTAIIGYGHIALMKTAKNDPVRLNIEHMLEAGDRAAHLTQDLLLFSRKQISERKPVDLNEIIRKVEKFLVRVIGEDIDCRTMLSSEAMPVLGDAHQLEQVLMNLATNARDAMATGGVFTVTTKRVTFNEDFISVHGYGKPGSYVLTTISDTGRGIDEVTREHMFEPFFTTKEVGKGTGLGLAVVYGIIKQHEGFVNVYSESGQGTTFKIYLPLIVSDMAKDTVIAEAQPMGGTETILLAEDDETVRNLTSAVLRDFGYTVISAIDGQDAVDKYAENRDTIQLLLFDLIMPKKTGKEAYDEIRAASPEVNALFASGYAPDLVRQKVLIDDKMPVIFKPVSPTELLKQVRIALDRHDGQ